MKKFTAILNNGLGHVSRVDYDYNSKKNYARDCRGNGYKVTAILTDDEIQFIKSNPETTKYSNLVVDFVRQCL